MKRPTEPQNTELHTKSKIISCALEFVELVGLKKRELGQGPTNGPSLLSERKDSKYFRATVDILMKTLAQLSNENKTHR